MQIWVMWHTQSLNYRLYCSPHNVCTNWLTVSNASCVLGVEVTELGHFKGDMRIAAQSPIMDMTIELEVTDL